MRIVPLTTCLVLLVGCSKPAAPATPAKDQDRGIVFDGQLWRPTGATAQVDLYVGEVYDCDDARLRLVVARPVMPIRSDSQVVERRLVERRDGDRWIQHGMERNVDGEGEVQVLMYQDGKLNGEQLVYRSDGSLQLRRNWSRGQMHGIETQYDSDGKATGTYRYLHGEPQ